VNVVALHAVVDEPKAETLTASAEGSMDGPEEVLLAEIGQPLADPQRDVGGVVTR
jgi:hypothetical protein